MRSVFVVTISETLVTKENKVDFVVFSCEAKAVEWIDRHIRDHVKSNNLDLDSDVDGWFVEIEGMNHTIQYDIVEKDIL